MHASAAKQNVSGQVLATLAKSFKFNFIIYYNSKVIPKILFQGWILPTRKTSLIKTKRNADAFLKIIILASQRLSRIVKHAISEWVYTIYEYSYIHVSILLVTKASVLEEGNNSKHAHALGRTWGV